jgi:hypothetical protein
MGPVIYYSRRIFEFFSGGLRPGMVEGGRDGGTPTATGGYGLRWVVVGEWVWEFAR